MAGSFYNSTTAGGGCFTPTCPAAPACASGSVSITPSDSATGCQTGCAFCYRPGDVTQSSSTCPPSPSCAADTFVLSCGEGKLLGIPQDDRGCIVGCPACFAIGGGFGGGTTGGGGTSGGPTRSTTGDAMSSVTGCGVCSLTNKPLCEGDTLATETMRDGCCQWRCAQIDSSTAARLVDVALLAGGVALVAALL